MNHTLTAVLALLILCNLEIKPWVSRLRYSTMCCCLYVAFVQTKTSFGTNWWFNQFNANQSKHHIFGNVSSLDGLKSAQQFVILNYFGLFFFNSVRKQWKGMLVISPHKTPRRSQTWTVKFQRFLCYKHSPLNKNEQISNRAENWNNPTNFY